MSGLWGQGSGERRLSGERSSPEHSGGKYLKALARISRFFRDAAFRQKLSQSESLEDVVRAIEEEDAKL